MPIDYERGPDELFIDIGNRLLERYKNLDIFSFISHELSPSTYNCSAIVRKSLPSWVSTLKFGVRETWPLVTVSITYPIVSDAFRACGEQCEVQESRTRNEVEGHSRASRTKQPLPARTRPRSSFADPPGSRRCDVHGHCNPVSGPSFPTMKWLLLVQKLCIQTRPYSRHTGGRSAQIRFGLAS